MLMFGFKLVASVAIVLRIAVGLDEGDSCTLKDGTNGVCKNIEKCQSALDEIKSRVVPVNCGFIGNDAIVCCKRVSHAVTAVTIEKTQSTSNTEFSESRQSLPSNRVQGRISQEKCEEYTKYAHEKMPSNVLSLIQPTEQLDFECPYYKVFLIIGNPRVSPAEYPHVALIGFQQENETEWLCVGSLISERFILTAGHCTKHRSLGHPKFVKIGLNKETSEYTQQRSVVEVIRHPKYVNTKYHDIALLKVDRDFELNPYVRPACLRTEPNISFNTALSINLGPSNSAAEDNKEMIIESREQISQENCNETYKRDIVQPNSQLKDGILDDIMICTKIISEDNCQWSTGGPLQLDHKNPEKYKCVFDIVGVKSFGENCSSSTKVPSVSTKVSAYIDWIEDTVWPA